MSTTAEPGPPIRATDTRGRLELAGPWTTAALGRLQDLARDFPWPSEGAVTLDAAEISALDTAGAWLLDSLRRRLAQDGRQVELAGLRPEYRALVELVTERTTEQPHHAPAPPDGGLARLGRKTLEFADEGLELVGFFGQTVVFVVHALARPGRIRWRALMTSIDEAGVAALPILGLLSFLIGIVVAYQGAVQLRQYGANIFIVELITITMFREMAPMMAAIIVAGRTGSAYAAQIGTMRVTEEVDALRTMGIAPMDLLVLPKLFGLVLALPLLTVYADALSVFGGMVMAAAVLDVSFREFFDRIPEAVSLTSFMIGISKAPVFAGIIALVGCYQGFRVEGGADSVGQHTTLSVVQSIFLVILADAAFSILYSWLDI